MTKALYRKYRSKKFDEIAGQEHITKALTNALSNNRIAHAYLFTGPRGVGKTSIARIFAHEVNSLPYNDDSTHLDIIEIDAASNRRIDEVRSLREKVHNAPASARYKVYIIDEVHMLTNEAFNALLKTLEEPPSHVIFILATTEVHKLPETIISRTQRYTFKPAEKSTAVKHLQSITKSEGLKIEKEAIELIAEHGRGSFRDSISLLDQIGNTGGKITVDDVRQSLGIAPKEAIENLINHIAKSSPSEIIASLNDLHEQGYPAAQIAKQINSSLRQQLLEDTSYNQMSSSQIAKLIEKLINIPSSHDPFVALEITILEPAINRAIVVQPNINELKIPETPVIKKSVKLPTESTHINEKPSIGTTASATDLESKTKNDNVSEPVSPAKFGDTTTKAGHTILNEESWQNILHSLKQNHNTLYGIARMAQPEFAENKLILCFAFPFHQKRMNDAKNTKIISSIIHQQTGNNIAIECIIKKSETKQQPSVKNQIKNEGASDTDPLNTISNIFGGGEILD